MSQTPKLFGRSQFLAVFAAIAAVLPGAAEASSGSQIALLAADARSVTLELTLPEYRLLDRLSGRGLEREIVVPGWSFGAAAGRPKLPVTGTWIQVPAGAMCRLSVIETEFDSLYGHPNPAVPRLEADDEGRIVAVEEHEAAVYVRDAFYPGFLAEAGEPASMRGVPVVRVLLHPFQWNPLSRELRVHKKIRVRVDFDREQNVSRNEISGDGDAYERMRRAVIINRSGGEAAPPAVPARPARPATWTNAVRIETLSRGIVRVAYEDLTAQGMPRGQSPAGLKMINRGEEIAFTVRPAVGAALGPGDAIEFYADAVDSLYTLANVYWLTWEVGGGPMMPSRPAAPVGGTGVGIFRDETTLETNAGIWYQTPGAPAHDFWFWTRLTAPMEMFVPLTLPPDALSDGHEMIIQAAFQGRSAAGHRTSIAVNGETWSDQSWQGDRVYVQTAGAAQSEAKIGANVIRIKAPGVPGTLDVSYLNWIKVKYWRSLTALDDAIEFDLEDTGAITAEVGGFSTSDVEAFDVTDPARPVRLEGLDVIRREGKYVARFGDALAARHRYHVATVGRLGQAARIESWTAGELLGTDRQADMIVIAPREIERSGAALASFRLTRRIQAVYVRAEDIYNEFGHGIVDPAAIRAFLTYAYRSWRRPAPLYVVLLGDSTIDTKGYLAGHRASQIPVLWEWTADLGLTPSDNGYACVDGEDQIPDMLIGRVPGGPLEEAQAAVEKLISADVRRQAPVKRVLLVADNDDADFETINNQVLDFLPPGYANIKVYLRTYGSAAQAASDIIATIDGGVDLVSYVGHGSQTDWAAEKIFTASKVAELSNAGHMPLFCTFNCLNGFFCGTTSDSLAEALVGTPGRGGYAAIAPSGLGYPWEHSILLKEMMTLLFQGGGETLGAIATQAKIAAYGKGVSEDILKMFTLFGDPAMRAFAK